MKIATILSVAGLGIFSVIGLAQISNPQVSISTNITAPQAADMVSNPKCGVESFGVNDECGVDMYKNARIQCYDNFEPVTGDDSSCKSSETWRQYAKDACANHCAPGYVSPPLPTPTSTTPSVNPATPEKIIPATKTETYEKTVPTTGKLITPVTPEITVPTTKTTTTGVSPQTKTETHEKIVPAAEKPITPVTPETTVPATVKPITPVISETTVPATKTTTTGVSPQATTFSSSTQCGVTSFKVNNECGIGLYKNAYIQCSDGYKTIMGEGSSCKSSETWSQYAKDSCANHCSNGDTLQPLQKPPTPVISEATVPATVKPITPVISETTVPAAVKPITPSVSPMTITTSLSPTKCGMNSFGVYNECGAGVYKNVYAKCYDGFEVYLGGSTSCKPADLWNQYAGETCASRCSNGGGSGTVSKPVSASVSTPIIYAGDTTEGGNRSTPLKPSSVPIVEREWVSVCSTIDNLTQQYNELVLELQNPKLDQLKKDNIDRLIVMKKQYIEEIKKTCATNPQNASRVAAPPIATEPPTSIPMATPSSKPAPKPISVCYISDNLMQEYNRLIVELQKSESDKARAEKITQQIIALKQQIATQQKECVNTSPQITPVPQITPATVLRPIPTGSPVASPTTSPVAIENIPVAVSIDRCNEVAQWKTKIAYYKKLGNLSEDDLKKSGFSREEIEKILQELTLGIEKVRSQCGSQEKTPVIPRITAITGSAAVTETVKPVVIESGQEISVYYKSRLEKAVSAKGEGKQIEELKILRDEIDGLISNLIKSRQELEVSELNNLVKEVKISRGEIKADDIAVKTTEKKMLINVGDRSVSIEPTVSQVLIRDKGLKVKADEVTIKKNVLSVGGSEVKMSASEVTEKLGLVPRTIELKEENAKAVYNMDIDEHRKLFGFIPIDNQMTVTADAENGNVLAENPPWYGFLTTK